MNHDKKKGERNAKNIFFIITFFEKILEMKLDYFIIIFVLIYFKKKNSLQTLQFYCKTKKVPKGNYF